MGYSAMNNDLLWRQYVNSVNKHVYGGAAVAYEKANNWYLTTTDWELREQIETKARRIVDGIPDEVAPPQPLKKAMRMLLAHHMQAAQVALEDGLRGPRDDEQQLNQILDELHIAGERCEVRGPGMPPLANALLVALMDQVTRARDRLVDQAADEEGESAVAAAPRRLCNVRTVEVMRQLLLPFNYAHMALLFDPSLQGVRLGSLREVSDAFFPLQGWCLVGLLEDRRGPSQGDENYEDSDADSEVDDSDLDTISEHSVGPPPCACSEPAKPDILQARPAPRDAAANAASRLRNRLNALAVSPREDGPSGPKPAVPSPLRQSWTPDDDSSAE